ncbi:MAG: hypothetical protein FWE30_07750 [Bacteroidales bacterium]|nr:hypothetical protein [Bacteroidales bacterium]
MIFGFLVKKCLTKKAAPDRNRCGHTGKARAVCKQSDARNYLITSLSLSLSLSLSMSTLHTTPARSILRGRNM